MTAEQMRAWRALHGYTQRQLARAIGMSASRIIDYERGASRAPGRSATIPLYVELALAGMACRNGRCPACRREA